MICFITPNTGEWSGVFYAVDNDDFIDIPDESDPGFIWRGLVDGNTKVLINYSSFGATHFICNDKGLVHAMKEAIAMHLNGKFFHRDVYGNFYTITKCDVRWAKYRIHIAWDEQ